jgi:hypothetical protein
MHTDLETIYENMLATPRSSDRKPEYRDNMYAEKPADAFEKPTPVEEPASNASIAEDILKQAKALRRIAKEDNYNSKIYYRARNIQQLAEKLLGLPSSDDGEEMPPM